MIKREKNSQTIKEKKRWKIERKKDQKRDKKTELLVKSVKRSSNEKTDQYPHYISTGVVTVYR